MDKTGNLSSAAPRVLLNKTKRALAYALLASLEHTAFEKITVNQICEEALVGRSTFYVHFEDKYDLLRFSLLALQEKLATELAGQDEKAYILQMVKGFRANKSILLNLMANPSNYELRDMMQTLIMDHVKRHSGIQEKADALGILPEVVLTFFMGGVTGLLMWWVHARFALEDETIAGYICALISGMPCV